MVQNWKRKLWGRKLHETDNEDYYYDYDEAGLLEAEGPASDVVCFESVAAHA